MHSADRQNMHSLNICSGNRKNTIFVHKTIKNINYQNWA